MRGRFAELRSVGERDHPAYERVEAVESGLVSLASPAGLAAVNAAVTRQFLLRKPATAPAAGHAILE
jgi:hypothetical protein